MCTLCPFFNTLSNTYENRMRRREKPIPMRPKHRSQTTQHNDAISNVSVGVCVRNGAGWLDGHFRSRVVFVGIVWIMHRVGFGTPISLSLALTDARVYVLVYVLYARGRMGFLHVVHWGLRVRVGTAIWDGCVIAMRYTNPIDTH